MFGLRSSGSFKNTNRFLEKAQKQDIKSFLEKHGQHGIAALERATPRDTGMTAASWSYHVESSKGRHHLYYSNSNVNKGVPIAVILQYGHGTGTGGYVRGRDYINPAMKPVFDVILLELIEEVNNL